MYMSNIFIIHMNHDIGRFEHMEEFRKIVNGVYWEGEYVVPCDKDQFKLKMTDRDQGTFAAKTAKIKLFKYFLENCDQDYIIVFEDDIIWHKKFYKYWSKTLDIIKRNDDWKLLYFGVSGSLNKDYIDELKEEFQIVNLPTGKIFTGAYGFILRRDVIKDVLEKAEDPSLKYVAFDYTCLGHIQTKFRDQCFITIPELTIVDVSNSNIRGARKQDDFIQTMGWNLNNYYMRNKINLFILVNNNYHKIERCLKEMNVLYPLIKVHIIHIGKINNQTAFLLNKYREQGIHIYNINEEEFDLNLIILIKKIVKDNYFIITNISISWKHPFPKDFFKIIDNIFDRSNVDFIEFEISQCKRCMNKSKNISNLKYYQGFSVIKNYDFTKKLKIKGPFYSNNCCYEISDNSYHNLHIDDVVQDIQDYNNDCICRSYPSLLELDELKWINIFKDWLKHYFYESIKLVTGNTEIDTDAIDVSRVKIKDYNSTKFNLLKFGHKINNDKIVIYIDTFILFDILGPVIYDKLNTVLEKYNVQFENLEFTVNIINT